MEKIYWIRINDESKGPYSLNDLKERNALPNNYVWTEGFKNWVQLSEVPEYKIFIKQNKINPLSTILQYLLIISVGLFFLLFLYNFFKLPYYKENYGGGNGMDIIGEVAFDDTPLKLKLPTKLFFYLIPIIFILIFLYGIIKAKIESRIPIYIGLILIIGIPAFMISYHPQNINKQVTTNISLPPINNNVYPLKVQGSTKSQYPTNIKYVIVHLKTIENSGSGFDENGIYQSFIPVENDNVTGVSEFEYFDETERAKLEDIVVSKYLNSIEAKLNKGRILSKKTFVFDSYIEASNKRNEFLIDK